MGPPKPTIFVDLSLVIPIKPTMVYHRVCWGYNYLITRGAPSCGTGTLHFQRFPLEWFSNGFGFPPKPPAGLQECLCWMPFWRRRSPFKGQWRNPKDHWTLKTGFFEDPTPAIQVQTLPLEGPRSLGNMKKKRKIEHNKKRPIWKLMANWWFGFKL